MLFPFFPFFFSFFFFSAALGKVIALLHRVSAVGEVKCERFRHAANHFLLVKGKEHTRTGEQGVHDRETPSLLSFL